MKKINVLLFFVIYFVVGHAQNKINVKNFGAVGDGVHDDTKAIQLAISTSVQKNGITFFPAGTYMVSQLNVDVSMSGENGTIIKRINDTRNDKYHFCRIERHNGLSIYNIVFDGNVVVNKNGKVVDGGIPLIVVASSNIKIVSCKFQNSPMAGLRIESKSSDIRVNNCKTSKTRGIYGDGYYIETSYNVNVLNCVADDYTRIGFVVERSSNNVNFNNCNASFGHDASILTGGIEYNSGFWYENSQNVTTTNCVASNNTHYGFVASAGKISENGYASFSYNGCKSLNNAIGYKSSSSFKDSPIKASYNNCTAEGVSRGFDVYARNNLDQFNFNTCRIVILSKAKQGTNDAAFQWGSSVITNNSNLPTFNFIDCIVSYTKLVPTDELYNRNTNNADISTYNGGYAILNIDNCKNLSTPNGFLFKVIRGVAPKVNVKNTKLDTRYMVKKALIHFLH